MSDSRQYRVYLASPFRDMMAERQHLATVVAPLLRSRCEERGIVFELVDLRSSAVEETEAAQQVAAGFFDAIERCRPYFIGLLGDRCGEATTAFPEDVLTKLPWLAMCKSMIELEFLHGALRNPSEARQASFYFRDPNYNQALPETERQTPPEAEEADRVYRLKAAVRAGGLNVKENFPDPLTLGELILSDLTRSIDSFISDAPKTTQLSLADLERLLSASCKEPVDSVDLDPADETGSPSGARLSQTASSSDRSVRLIHLSGSMANTAQEFYIDQQDEVWIGRDPVSHVRYSESDQSVSRAHMKIVPSFGAPNAYILVSRGRNGTFINNTEVSGSSAIRDGDVVQVGRGGPVYRFEQFPKPQARPGMQDRESEDISMAPADAQAPREGLPLVSGATTELKYDPVLAWSMLQEKEAPKVSGSIPNTVPRDITDRVEFNPLADPPTISRSFRTQIIALGVVVVGLLAVWLIWKR